MTHPEQPKHSVAASKYNVGMKYALTLLCLTALALAQNAPSSNTDQSSSLDQNSSALPTDQENVRKAKAILEEGIQALGGQAYLNWQEQTQEGRAYSFHHGEANSLGTIF